MDDRKRNLTRRDFLRGTAGAAVAGASVALAGRSDSGARPAGSPPAAPASGNVPASSTVVLVRESGVLDSNGRVVPAVLASMLDRAVCELAGQTDPVAAFKTFLKPTDTLGIKTNVWRFLATPPALEQALRQRAIDCGIPAAKIAIDDRGVLENPVFKSATALINVRPLRTHHWSGVGSLLKNYIMFSPSPPDWHGDSCADLGGLWKLPACAGKTRLNVLVMLTPLYQSEGPHDFNAKYTWPYKGLIVSTDAVAADATGLRILEAKRRAAFGTDQPFEVPPKHIRVAAEKFGLGVADPAQIRLKKLGWTEEVLI